MSAIIDFVYDNFAICRWNFVYVFFPFISCEINKSNFVWIYLHSLGETEIQHKARARTDDMTRWNEVEGCLLYTNNNKYASKQPASDIFKVSLV